MTFDWPNLIVGAILGFLAHWAFVELKEYSLRQKLKNRYSGLAGNYASYRVKDDGTEEPTGGTIRLTWQPEGSFRVQGLHPNAVLEWESVIRMSLEFAGTGTGHYRYVGSDDSGTQQVTYREETRCFIVLGRNATRSTGMQFVHRWKRIER
jgi:hypothetical protein